MSELEISEEVQQAALNLLEFYKETTLYGATIKLDSLEGVLLTEPNHLHGLKENVRKFLEAVESNLEETPADLMGRNPGDISGIVFNMLKYCASIANIKEFDFDQFNEDEMFFRTVFIQNLANVGICDSKIVKKFLQEYEI